MDAEGGCFRPAAVALREGQVAAIGTPTEVRRRIGTGGRTVRLADRLILPGMVNAHAHLDLTDAGPRAYGGDFVGWLMEVVRWRRSGSAKPQAAVRRGAAMSRAAGVNVVGDIAGREEWMGCRQAMIDGGLRGVSFVEVLGIGGAMVAESLAVLDRVECDQPVETSVTLGVQPHAPYTTLPSLYAAAVDVAVRRGLPVSTHLAELPDELEFVASARGPFRELWELLGIWDPICEPTYSTGQHPVHWLEPQLRRAPFLCAHVNYIDDDSIALLAETRSSVAYCPVASDYFHHRGHRYRDMIDAGVNVCLGTDSILCQPPDEPQPLGILAQMRHLYRRDRTDPQLLLKMATTNGMRGLQLEPAPIQEWFAVRFDPDESLDPLAQVLQNRYPVEPLTDLLKELDP